MALSTVSKPNNAVGPRATPKPAWQKGLWFLIGVPILLMIFGKIPFPITLFLVLILGIIAMLGQLGRPLRRDEKVAAVILGIGVLVATISFSRTPGVWKFAFGREPSTPATDRHAAQASSDRTLEQIMLSTFHDLGVEQVEVNEAFMRVYVTRPFYHMLYTNRLEGNRIIRDWQAMVAKSYSATGFGTVMLFTEGQKVAEADRDMRSSEVKVRWLDD